jgi:hypothetical protein
MEPNANLVKREPAPPARRIKTVRTTLGALGAVLPVGPATGARDFMLRPFNMPVHRAISDFREKAKGLTFGKLISQLLGLLIVNVGGESFEGKSDAERALFLAQAWAGDVLYLYFYARRHALGPDLRLDISCPSCDYQEAIETSIDDLDVFRIEDPTGTEFDVDLRDGVEHGGKKYRRLVCQPLRWHTMSMDEVARAAKNNAKRDSLVIRASVVGAASDPGGEVVRPFALTDPDLDTLSGPDLDTIIGTIEENGPGPHVAIEHTCGLCHFSFLYPINWGYDSFFKRYSPSRAGKS